MMRLAEAARLWRRSREMGSMKQHMLPMSCQFWWAGWVIQLRMARSE